MKTAKEVAKECYSKLQNNIADIRRKIGRPLTLAEKILFCHLFEMPKTKIERGKTPLKFLPDRVAMQDATAQMAILQFIVTEKKSTAVPTTIHCDHLIRAEDGADKDLLRAIDENEEVYRFLKSSAQKYGMGFWEPGAGIIHQVVLEQYAFPGGMMIGTDSHTPNAGGLGMIAIGVGGADAVDVMAGSYFGLVCPKLIGVKLTGKISGWTTPKDVILKVAEILTVKGGTGNIVEYFGDGANTISCTGKATITNMGAELGATTSIFPYDESMERYLKATEREEIANEANKIKELLRPDDEVLADPSKYYDQLIEINLSELEPAWVGPHTPDLRHPVSKIKERVKENKYPDNISYALIGSCTNSSYEDITGAASIAKQALDKGLKVKTPLLVTPGSKLIHKTIERDGLMDIFEKVGAVVLANACGPCIGQWKRKDVKEGERNTIVTSYNRNFRKRNDGNAETLAFISSPEMVTAVAFAGNLSFNPLEDSIEVNGDRLKFKEPQHTELPLGGFVYSQEGYIPPASEETRDKVKVEIDPNSERLAFLEPFKPWDGNDFTDLLILVKAKGKCTTDHISPAGPWLKYRGHLPNISKNMFSGAVNAFNGEVGKGTNVLTGEKNLSFYQIALYYKEHGKEWIAIGDENYGEGSSREHAAMEPRYMGCRAVLAKSFARIAETNLKKQGILPLQFKNQDDYNLFEEDDRVDIIGLQNLSPGSSVKVNIKKTSGEKIEIECIHSLTEEQIEWFKAGSALNTLK